MANKKQLAILKQGVTVWNKWREKNESMMIDLSGAHLRGTILRKADLREVDLRRTDFREADLCKADLSQANLRGADLRGANLRGANLRGAHLRGAHLSEADLREAHLRKADLREVNLGGADLLGAELRDADLRDADLGGADLGDADFGGVDLGGADLTRADLTKADLSEVTLGITTLGDIDLSTIKGLETVKHYAPSIVGIDTIYKSKGNIPEVFLRGCGVPENFITFMRSLAAQQKAFEYYSCFISYSSQDQEFAERIYADLQNKGIRCWFAPEDLKIGDKFRTRIDEAIRVYDKLLLVLSENSIQSDWVEKEVETAFEKERQQKRTMLFPVCIDDTVMTCPQAWAADIRRTRQIGDMTKWKEHDQYQKAFERLLRDLKAEAQG